MQDNSSFSTHNSKFTEAKLESAIISLLEQEGYPHVLGEELGLQVGEVLIKDDLRYCRAFYNFYVEPGIWQQAVAKLNVSKIPFYN